MKILHASDFHLDSPFHRLSAEQAQQRRRELRELPMALARLVQEEGIHLVLLPGDLFDGQRVYPETIEALKAAFESILIPVIIAPGNHDHIDKASPYLTTQWPDNVHIFTSPEVDSFDLLDSLSQDCVVHGYAFTTPHRSDEPLRGFAAPDDGRLHLLCAHGEVRQGGNYAPIIPGTLGDSGVTYAALGHIHAGTGLNWEGNTAWAYCGCPEGRGFDEAGQKGALVVTIDDNGISSKFVPLCRRQYRIEKVDAARFDECLPTIPSDDLVRILLTGESRTTPDLAAMLKKAQDRFFYAELRDETTLSQDLWARVEEDSLTGLFLRGMRRRLDSAAEEERPSILMAARFGLAALEGGEDICL